MYLLTADPEVLDDTAVSATNVGGIDILSLQAGILAWQQCIRVFEDAVEESSDWFVHS